MRYALLADVHSNLEALTAVLDRLIAQRIDRYLCLGDAIGYGADPLACLERLQACGAVMIAGNHELGCIGQLDLGWFHEAARASLEWTRDQLSFVDLNALRQLPLITSEAPWTLVHSSLKRPERFTYIVDVAQAVETLVMCRTLFCCVGHTHVPCVVEYDRSRRRLLRVLTAAVELAEVRVTVQAETMRYFVNPGSVGQPRDGDARASTAIIDTEARRIQCIRVPYDVAAAQEKIRRAGLPPFLADRLALGR